MEGLLKIVVGCERVNRTQSPSEVGPAIEVTPFESTKSTSVDSGMRRLGHAHILRILSPRRRTLCLHKKRLQSPKTTGVISVGCECADYGVGAALSYTSTVQLLNAATVSPCSQRPTLPPV